MQEQAEQAFDRFKPIFERDGMFDSEGCAVPHPTYWEKARQLAQDLTQLGAGPQKTIQQLVSSVTYRTVGGPRPTSPTILLTQREFAPGSRINSQQTFEIPPIRVYLKIPEVEFRLDYGNVTEGEIAWLAGQPFKDLSYARILGVMEKIASRGGHVL